MSGVASCSFIGTLSRLQFARYRRGYSSSGLLQRVAKSFKVNFCLLQCLGFSTKLDTPLHAWRKQQNTRDQKADSKPRQDRLIDRRRRLEQSEKISEGNLLFLILKKESKTQ